MSKTRETGGYDIQDIPSYLQLLYTKQLSQYYLYKNDLICARTKVTHLAGCISELPDQAPTLLNFVKHFAITFLLMH